MKCIIISILIISSVSLAINIAFVIYIVVSKIKLKRREGKVGGTDTEKADSKKKKEKTIKDIGLNLPVWISVFAMLVSLSSFVYSLCIRIKGDAEWGFDLNGALIGVLALLVTLLVSWQIFNYISFEKRIKDDVEERIGKIESVFNMKPPYLFIESAKINSLKNKDSFVCSVYREFPDKNVVWFGDGIYVFLKNYNEKEVKDMIEKIEKENKEEGIISTITF